MRLIRAGITSALMLLASGSLASGKTPTGNSGFEAGMEAYRSGDYKGAFLAWEKLAGEGNLKAAYRLGVLFEEGLGVKKDYARAARLYTVVVVGDGPPGALYRLGRLYDLGLGVPRSHDKAKRLYALAAKGGYSPSKTRPETVAYARLGSSAHTESTTGERAEGAPSTTNRRQKED